MTRSRLERLFLPLAAAAGIPVPLTRQVVNGYEVDFYWPELKLVVETDGWTYHRTPAKQASDNARSHKHFRAGLLPIRFSHWEIAHDPAAVRDTLAEVAERLGWGAPPARSAAAAG